MIETPGRFHSKATDHVVAGANEILDDELQKKQSVVNAENESFKDAQTELNEAQSEFNSEVREALGTGGTVDERIANAVNTEKDRAEGAEEALDGRIETLEEAVGEGGSVDERIADEGARHYTKDETYNKTELNNLITTPSQEYVSVTATDQTTSVIDVLPATGVADTIYRVGNWDGTQYNDSVFTEYAWNGSAYIELSTKSQIGEVYDISENHADTKYSDLAAALGVNGANIPQSLRKGGMSVKFVQSSDNKYVQWRLVSEDWNIDINNWVAENEDFRNKVMQEVNEAIDSIQPIEITGDVTNAPDEEDLTSVNVGGTDVLKFKDKAYNPLTYSGLGRKILRKNIVDGVNTLTQEMMSDANTLYIIQYDFVLGGNIIVPANCVLEFDGGSINGTNTITLGTTKCFGVNALHCPVTSVYPIRTSLMGIGNEWEDDSAQSLNRLVYNRNKIIVDTNITCLSPVYCTIRTNSMDVFYVVGDYSYGYRRPAYTITFPNSEGFVLNSNVQNGISFGHCFKNIQIVSNGTCINFAPSSNIAAVFAETTFENLYLESKTGDCINQGSITSTYSTAGFNQYVRNVQALSKGGACFRGMVCYFDRVSIYGSVDGGFYNCSGDFNHVIFDQYPGSNASNGYYLQIYGWRWVNLNMSGGLCTFKKCSFEALKYAMYADATYDSSIYIEDMLVDHRNYWDENGEKKYNPFELNNCRELTIINLRGGIYGGGFAKNYSRFQFINRVPIIKGQTLTCGVGNTLYPVEVGGSSPDSISDIAYTNLEQGKKRCPKYFGAKYDRLESQMFCYTPLYESANDFVFTYGYISTNGVLGKTVVLSTSRNFKGFSAISNIPYGQSLNKVFTFYVINKSDGNITLVHRGTGAGGGKFNNFTGADIILKPNDYAYCIFNGAQIANEIQNASVMIDVVKVFTRDNVCAGSKIPISPFIGQQFFDTTSGVEKPIWHKGNNVWVDSLGTVIYYSVSTNLTNVKSNGGDYAKSIQSYSATLTANTGYSLPATITIKMNNTTLTAGTDYTYNQSTGEIEVLGTGGTGGVTGNLVITAVGVADS